MTNTYIDTSVLVESILGKNKAKSEDMRTLSRIQSTGQKVMMPQLVIGETYFQIYDDEISTSNEVHLNVKKFTELIQSLVPITHGCTPAFSKEILELSLEIREKDSNLDYCDSLIVSHVLLDLDSRYLYTMDTSIQESTFIQQKLTQRKNDGNEVKVKDIR